jgi:hypothetical protein
MVLNKLINHHGQVRLPVTETRQHSVCRGETITSVERSGDGVHVTFEHAPARWFDLLVGAEGADRVFTLQSGRLREERFRSV